MRQRDRQSVFSIMEGLLVVLAIAVVSVAGWLVYQHNRTKVTSAAAGNTQTSQTTQPTTTIAPASTPVPAQNIVKIPELSLQIAVPDNIKDLNYKIGTTTLKDGRQETYATFSTVSLTAADANCGTNFGPLGSLAKISGQYPTSFSDSNPPIEYGVLVKQFPTYFISSSGPQAACSARSSVLTNASASRGAFGSSFSTIQPSN